MKPKPQNISRLTENPSTVSISSSKKKMSKKARRQKRDFCYYKRNRSRAQKIVSTKQNGFKESSRDSSLCREFTYFSCTFNSNKYTNLSMHKR